MILIVSMKIIIIIKFWMVIHEYHICKLGDKKVDKDLW